jgi:CheY-like chemotaxis protein
MRLLLEETGHRVSVAGTVAAAVDAASVDPPDVLLLDLTLPDGDGLAVLARLAERGAQPRAAVALTGHDDPETRARCLAAGCREVLLKPVPARDLVRMVGEWARGE